MSWTSKAHNILMSFVPSSVLLPNTGFRVLSFCNFDKLVCCCSIKEGTVWTKVWRRVCWPTHLAQVPAGNWRCNGVLQAGALHGPEYSGSWITGAWKAVAYQGFCKELWVPVVEVIQVDSGSRLLLKSLSFFFMGIFTGFSSNVIEGLRPVGALLFTPFPLHSGHHSSASFSKYFWVLNKSWYRLVF